MEYIKLQLNSMAMLCEFSASTWTARKLDRKKSDEVVSGAHAKAKGAARVNKNLLAGRGELEELQSFVTKVRDFVYANTLPWSNNGQRLIVTARMPAFDKQMRAYMEEFDTMVKSFVDLYPSLITAQAMALGDMFNRDEFPRASEIARKFAMSCEYLPVPAAGDIRVDIVDQAQEELRERLTFMTEKRVEAAVGDLRNRLKEHLQRMSERLVTETDDKTGDPKSRKFTDTVISGALDLCNLVADYNLTHDPELQQARKVLEAKLSGLTVTTLRDDHAKREDVRGAVQALLSKFEL